MIYNICLSYLHKFRFVIIISKTLFGAPSSVLLTHIGGPGPPSHSLNLSTGLPQNESEETQYIVCPSIFIYTVYIFKLYIFFKVFWVVKPCMLMKQNK